MKSLFESFLLSSGVSELYKEIKDYSVQKLHIPMEDTKMFVGFGKYEDFYMYFIGLKNDELLFSARIEYKKLKDSSNIIRLPFIEENRDKIFECINNIYNDYLQCSSKRSEEDNEFDFTVPYRQEGQLDVVLATPIEEIVPKMIEFNNLALMEKVNEYLKKYDGRKYDESAIGIAKRDRRHLNSLSTKLNKERLRIAKIYKAPYESFKAQVDEVIDNIKVVSEKIDVQIKEFENEARKIKLEKIKEFFNSVFEEFAKLISYDSIHKEKWLNPSEKMSDVFAEIKSIFIQIKSNIARIEALESEDENLIKNYYFRTLDIDKALAEAEEHKKARQAIEELAVKRTQNNNPMQSSAQVVERSAENENLTELQPSAYQVVSADLSNLNQEPATKNNTDIVSGCLQTIVLTVGGTDEQITDLKNYLMSSGMKFEISESGVEKNDNCDKSYIECVGESSGLKAKALKILRRLYGEDAEFRKGQYEAIEATLTNRRTLIVQKTGWGKSIVYFTATKLLRDEGRGVTVVVSPLLSLMENQMEAAIKLNLCCESFNSAMKKERRAVAIEGLIADKYDLIFITPETLFNPEINKALQKTRIGLFVIDEAHCISDWGNDFRLDYSNLHKIIGAMPTDVPVLATTATANDRVIEDIKKQFGNNVFVSRGPLTRESLAIQVVKLANRADRYAWILKNINKLPGTGIIYCLTRSDCMRLCEYLVQNGIEAMAYYSGDDEIETANSVALEKFKNNRLKVIVATIKLGMGYDKGDIGFVIHYQMPPNIVSYYQQIGRAGRNIEKAYAILMCGTEDDDIHEYFINEAFPTKDECFGIVSIIERNGGTSLRDIERKANISYRRIEKVVAFLVHEGALYRDGNMYYLTPKKFVYNEKHYNEITEQRKKEYMQMKELVELKTCYSKYIANCLDDFSAHECGNCANCIGENLIEENLENADRESATIYLNNFMSEIKPLEQWESDSITGRIDIDKRNETGICLSRYNDEGYGVLVRQGKYDKKEFDIKLIKRSAEVLKPIINEHGIKHICCVPSLRSDLVKDFTVKLAAMLGVEFVDCLIKSSAEPQKSMQNSAFQCKNAWESFSVAKCIIPEKLIIVDDIIDSKWTITVCGYKLMQKGARFVFPFALADSSRR